MAKAIAAESKSLTIPRSPRAGRLLELVQNPDVKDEGPAFPRCFGASASTPAVHPSSFMLPRAV